MTLMIIISIVDDQVMIRMMTIISKDNIDQDG